jgi:hypothetical protein
MKKLLLPLFAIGLVLASGTAVAQSDEKPSQLNIHIRDYCDPTSFNAVLGDDACVRDTASGSITFSGFLGEIGADQSAGAWRFAPESAEARKRATLKIQNLGGETHTFTRVKRFGGGFVDVLNQASGNPIPAPECAQVVDGNLVPQPPGADNLFIPAGGSATHTLNKGEPVRYQCCIHPWMRTTINGDEDHHDHRR